jgi:hypothetical protein
MIFILDLLEPAALFIHQVESAWLRTRPPSDVRIKTYAAYDSAAFGGS